ncbi:hypothetical protein Spb1_35870 [Planctopirus ephydatiae]|uniref:Uncharacterized protein n=1 Tax=Planctopirus ephydatiae TaxID=2528019 RepID=A0A518GSS5_9PLAN|nr:hypothetical protein Spb1_35870 [Planctopirus ephydatiae]
MLIQSYEHGTVCMLPQAGHYEFSEPPSVRFDGTPFG